MSVKATLDAAARSEVSGISATVRQKLERLGLRRRLDLVLHLPLRYEDETKVVHLSDAPPGQTVQVECEVEDAAVQYRPKRMLVCRVHDGEDLLYLRFFNFYPSQQKQLAPGSRLRVLGELRKGFFGAEMIHPRFRVLRADEPLPQSLTPVYPTTAGLSQVVLRRLVQRTLDAADLSDTLPTEVIGALKLPSFKQSIAYLHNPPPDARLEALDGRTHPAWRRIKFDELLAQQLSMRKHYRQRQTVAAPRLSRYAELATLLLSELPFSLTRAQQRVLGEIRSDLARAHPMQRLLQGDVGSGKTVVAALAALQAVESGYQVAVMAPTEILAEQHYVKFSQWLAPLGVGLARLAGNLGRKEKRTQLEGCIERYRQGGGRHPRPVSGRGEVSAAGAGYRRRAASLRCAPTSRAAAERRGRCGAAASADDERHTHPAHTGDELLRRPGRVGHRRAAAGSHPGRHQAGIRFAPRRGDRKGARCAACRVVRRIGSVL